MPLSPEQTIEAAIRALPESLQSAVRNWVDRLSGAQPEALLDFVSADGDLRALMHVVACSEFAGNIAINQWQWFCASFLSRELEKPHSKQPLQNRFDLLLADATDNDSFKRDLRVLRNQALFRILWRDLVSACELPETLNALSDLAECALNAASAFASIGHRERFGTVAHDGSVMPLVVLAMGKLGGRELNFSSDIDVIFLYPGEGNSDGERSLSAHEYFARYARQVVKLLEEVTTDGFVYRVDTRLRPFGASGPPVVSFAALESYLLQHGRNWERYAYVKSRVVVPSAREDSISPLLKEIIEPFVYRRYLDYGVFESLRQMHALVSVEVKKREMEKNIKLGPGGIREVEFIVQSLQLVRGGNVVGLRQPGLRAALESAVAERDIDRQVASDLLCAYVFLRHIENRIQAVRDQQTHEVPNSRIERDRLALAMRYPSWDDLASDLARHRTFVSGQFTAIALRSGSEQQEADAAPVLATLWAADSAAKDWQVAFEKLEFGEPVAVADVISHFSMVARKQKIDSIVAKRLRKFVPTLLLALQRQDSPAETLKRVLNIVEKVLRRSAYIALLNENRAVLERLVGLCKKSRYLAEEIGRFPLLLDEMLDPRLYHSAPDADVMRADLESGLATAGQCDSERRIEIVGHFQRATMFRLAVADLSGVIPIMQVSDRLTDLAEIVLRRALSIAYQDLVVKYGEPRYVISGRRYTAGFGIIAYGKLGGMELSYGSDLDLVFLHDSAGERQQTDGDEALENSVFFARLARRLVHFLTTQTGSGVLYDIDTRLRPSGRSGLLVVSVEAFERYQEENAWTWEHQALLRSRPVAGSPKIARSFEHLRAQTLRERVRLDTLQDEVSSMREKMRNKLDTSNNEQFDLKQGRGGIGDIEFLVQFLVLASAATHPAVIHYPDNIRQIGTLIAATGLSEATGQLLQETYRIYRTRLHRLALDGQALVAGEDEFREQRKFVRELWARSFNGEAL
jgi:glutamate-ammonia-ligase adenylyltransferase